MNPYYLQKDHGRPMITIDGTFMASAPTNAHLEKISATTISGANCLIASMQYGYQSFKNASSPVSPFSLVSKLIFKLSSVGPSVKISVTSGIPSNNF
jgi:hypothetical protein